MRWDEVRRVLCVRLDTIGDVLMTSPALRALRGGREREIVLLTSSIGAEVGKLIPEVDEVVAYDPPWMKATAPRPDARHDESLIADLGGRGLDAAVVFTAYSQSPLPAAFVCHLAGIPRRLAHCRENPYQLLTDWVRDPEPDPMRRHEVRRQLDLVATVGFQTEDERLSLSLPDFALEAVALLLAGAGVDPDGRWALFHPGASAESRRYPPESFAAAAAEIAEDLPVVFSGSRDEIHLVEGIRDTMGAPSASLAGLLSLPELAAAIRLASVTVSNNTGPAHLSAALGTPVVDLYALTNPQHAPWMVPHRVLYHDVPCANCHSSICREGHHLCLRGVPPSEVVRAAFDLLEGVESDGHAGGPVVEAPSGVAGSPAI